MSSDSSSDSDDCTVTYNIFNSPHNSIINLGNSNDSKTAKKRKIQFNIVNGKLPGKLTNTIINCKGSVHNGVQISELTLFGSHNLSTLSSFSKIFKQLQTSQKTEENPAKKSKTGEETKDV